MAYVTIRIDYFGVIVNESCILGSSAKRLRAGIPDGSGKESTPDFAPIGTDRIAPTLEWLIVSHLCQMWTHGGFESTAEQACYHIGRL